MGRKARLDLVLDCAEPQELESFWRDALGYRVYFSSASAVILVPDDDTNASPLVLQQVPEAKVGKNRMHFDLVADDISSSSRSLTYCTMLTSCSTRDRRSRIAAPRARPARGRRTQDFTDCRWVLDVLATECIGSPAARRG